ncbi:MAG: lysine transporter LysE [Ammonifex sp.]|nr:MAG: lysine transporter LysE [Ammonifex sp.]
MGVAGLFLTAFIVALTGAMMPGPLLTVTVAETVRRGFWAGPLLVVGHGILEAALVAALAFGLGPIIARQGVVAGISLIGGGFLLWMGLTIIRDTFKGRVVLDLKQNVAGPQKPLQVGYANSRDSLAGDEPLFRGKQGAPSLYAGDKRAPAGAHTAGRLIGLGVAVSLSNPYWSLWWATIGISYMNIALHAHGLGIVVFFAGHILADLAWYTAVSGAVSGGRRFLSPGLYRGILAVAGFFLVGLAGYFVISGLGL